VVRDGNIDMIESVENVEIEVEWAAIGSATSA
jgi:hypothetical protein